MLELLDLVLSLLGELDIWDDEGEESMDLVFEVDRIAWKEFPSLWDIPEGILQNELADCHWELDGLGHLEVAVEELVRTRGEHEVNSFVKEKAVESKQLFPQGKDPSREVLLQIVGRLDLQKSHDPLVRVNSLNKAIQLRFGVS